jgi:hypothetical protein
MDIIIHANVLPWQVDITFLMQLIVQAVVGACVLCVSGVLYAGLYRLLSHRSCPYRPKPDNLACEKRSADAWNISFNPNQQEGVYDEA